MNKCSAYKDGKCSNGFAVVSSICHGIGNGLAAPMCMREDPPKHLLAADGLPHGYPREKREQQP